MNIQIYLQDGNEITLEVVPPSSGTTMQISIYEPSKAASRHVFATQILSVSMFDTFGTEVTQFAVPAKICFAVANVRKDNACLQYETDSGEWECEDSCLKESKEGMLCGETPHFTNFAILLGDVEAGNCDSTEEQVIAWLSLAFIILGIGFCLVVSAVYEMNVRKRMKKRASVFSRSTPSRLSSSV